MCVCVCVCVPDTKVGSNWCNPFVCMQAGLIYRAVKLHVRLHNWQRALDLAVKHKQHLDTVLMYRQRCVTQ